MRFLFNWLRSSVGRKLGSLLIFSTLTGVVGLGICYKGLLSIQGDILYADLLGDQSMLAQFLEMAPRLSGGGGLQNRTGLSVLTARFDEGIRVMRFGGVHEDRATPPPPPYLIASIDKIVRRWEHLKPWLDRMAAKETSTSEERRLADAAEPDLKALRTEVDKVDDEYLDREHMRRVQTRRFAGGAALGGLISMALGLWLLRRKVIAPLQEIEAAMRRFRDGDHDVRVTPRSHDELGSLASSFNAMVDRLNQLEHQMKQVFEQCPMDLFLKDLEGRFTFMNPHGAGSFAKPAEQMIGLRVDDFASPEAAAISRASDQKVIDHQRVIVEEHNYPYASGPTRILLVKFPLKRPDGTLYGIGGFAADLSDVRDAQEKLIESELRHKALFDSNWDALMTIEAPSWKFTECNPAAVKMFGAKDAAEFLSMGPTKISPEKQPDGRFSREKAAEMMARAMKEGHHSFEWTHRRFDGTVFPATVLLSRVEKNGRSFLQGTVRDISQHIHEEEDHKRLSTAIEHSDESVVITDPKGNILYVNPAFEKATGYTREEALGQNPRFLKSGKQDEAFYRNMWQTISSGRTWKGSFVNKRKDGTFYFEEASISPVLNAHGQIVNYVGVKWDVTKRVEMETELRQAQKMESVGRLAGGVAHDFNNILTAIIGYAQFLETDAAAGKAQVSDVKEILTAANRAASLTRQLLAFSRRQVLEPKKISLNDTVANIHKMLQRLIGEDIKINAVLAPQLPAVMADPGQIEQVLMNLTVNARDAMPNGGTITIKTSEILLDALSAEKFRGAPPGIFTMVSVGDTGVGMDEATKARVFEPFFTTKGPGKGTGLGLSMVYGIVKQSGGYVYFDSEVGKGTTFKIILPITAEPADGPAKKTDGGAVTGRETILLVEDEASVRGIALRALRDAGHMVLEASSGVEALKLTAEFKGEIHLLLSDVVMPGMDGWQLSERMAELFPQTKTLLMSGYTDKAALHREMESPGANFLQKPFTPAGLVRKVRQVLDAPTRQTRPTKL